jgi:hypothetical protein
MVDRFFRFVLSAAAALAILGCGSVSLSSNNATQAAPATLGFSLSVPTSIAVAPSSSQTISISIAPANGFSSAVGVVLSGLPAGVSASPATFTLASATLSETVVITANADVTPGPVALVVTATSGSLSQTATTSTSQADFALSGPTQPTALAAGGTAQVSVSAAGFNGFGGPVSAALAGLPAGVTASPSTLTLTPGVAQTITLSAAANAQPGSSTLTLQGSSGELSSNLMLPLALSAAVIVPPVPDFSLSVAPSAITLSAGGSSGQVTLSAAPINGFTGPISVFLSGLPSGVVAMPATFALTPGTPQQISLTVAATDTAAAATLVFSASAGTLEHTAELAVTITPPLPTFSLQVTPATLTLTPGGGAQSVSVSATPLYGFSGPINVVGSGLPAAVTASPSNLTLTPGVAQTVSVTAGSNAAAGTAFLDFLGTSGTISNSASVGLTINASTPDFVFSATPSSITVTPGTFQPVTLSIVPLSGFNSGVTVTTGSLPDGVVASSLVGASTTNGTGPLFPVPANIPPLAPNVPEVLYVGLPAGQSAPVTIDLEAIAGALTHSATVTANPASTTNASSDFYLSSTPLGLLLYPGETSSEGASELFVGAESFDAGYGASPSPTISLTSSLPAGMTSTPGLLPESYTGLGLNFTVAPNLVGSSGTLAFQATSGSSSGSMTREIDVPYSVVAAPELTQLLIPSTLTLPQGSTEDLYVALATTSQEIGTIAPGTMTVTGLPFGVTTTAPTNFGANFPVLLSEPFTAAPTTAVGSTPVTVTTTANGGQTQTSQFMLNVVSIPNFTLTATPTTFDMMEGTTQTFTLEADAINGFTGDVSVTLTASGDVTASLSTFTLTPGTPQVISVTAAATSGSGSIVVQATAGTLSQNLIVPVNVTPPGPNFSIAVPTSITLGETTSGEFEANSIGGFVGTITEVLSGLPAGLLLAEGSNINDLYYSTSQPSLTLYVTCGNQPSQSNPGSDCTPYVYVIDYNGVAAGTYPLTLTATYTPSGQPEGAPTYPITYTYQLSLVVTPPTFPCSASPASLTIAPGSSQNVAISATSLSGYEDLFSYSGLPSGVSATVYSSTFPSQPGGNYTTTYTLSAAANATPGSSVLTFTCQNEISPPGQGIGLNAYATQTVQVPITIGP